MSGNRKCFRFIVHINIFPLIVMCSMIVVYSYDDLFIIFESSRIIDISYSRISPNYHVCRVTVLFSAYFFNISYGARFYVSKIIWFYIGKSKPRFASMKKMKRRKSTVMKYLMKKIRKKVEEFVYRD